MYASTVLWFVRNFTKSFEIIFDYCTVVHSKYCNSLCIHYEFPKSRTNWLLVARHCALYWFIVFHYSFFAQLANKLIDWLIDWLIDSRDSRGLLLKILWLKINEHINAFHSHTKYEVVTTIIRSRVCITPSLCSTPGSTRVLICCYSCAFVRPHKSLSRAFDTHRRVYGINSHIFHSVILVAVFLLLIRLVSYMPDRLFCRFTTLIIHHYV